MIRKIGFTLLTLTFLGAAATYFFYSSFRSERLDSLITNSSIIDTSAGPIEYQLAGDSGPVVLFLHGTPGGYDQIISIPGFRVLAPSRPGYLRTPIAVGSTAAEQARAYAALLDALDINTVVVMGASGGGPSSIAFAATFPERTQSLIALEAVSQKIVLGDGQEPTPFFMKTDFLLWATLSLLDTFVGAEGIVNLLVPDPAIQRMILSDPEKTASMTGLIWSIWPISQRDEGQRNDIKEFGILELPSETITVPTLIIHGTQDINVPYAQSKRLAGQISGAILHTIEGGDHMMPFSHSEEVEEAITSFISANTTPADDGSANVALPEGWSKPFPGHRVIGNLYAVGTYDLSVFLLTSDAGHILINTGLADSTEQIRGNIESLGFKLEDIRILLSMQAHWDHTAALAEIKQIAGAQMWGTVGDKRILEDGGFSDPHFGGRQTFAPINVDRVLSNGDLIELGDIKLRMHDHPGHTEGSSSYSMRVSEDGRDYQVVIANMGTINAGKKLLVDPTYPGVADDFARTYREQKAMKVDVWVAAHGGQYGLHEKYQPGQPYSPDTFVDPEGFLAEVERLEDLYRKQIVEEQQ